jgi:hypothetical protein
VSGHEAPFRFTGKINTVTFNLAPKVVSAKEKKRDQVAQFQAALKAA